MTQRIETTAEASASVDDVWALLADPTGWASWGPWDATELEQEGTPPPGGVGAVRRMRIGRRTLRERTTVFEPGKEMAYTVISGIPVRDYVGRVQLAATPRGTLITWGSTFRGAFPGLGPLVRISLAPKMADINRRLARAAEARVGLEAER